MTPDRGKQILRAIAIATGVTFGWWLGDVLFHWKTGVGLPAVWIITSGGAIQGYTAGWDDRATALRKFLRPTTTENP